jgi:hypothetical protein
LSLAHAVVFISLELFGSAPVRVFVWRSLTCCMNSSPDASLSITMSPHFKSRCPLPPLMPRDIEKVKWRKFTRARGECTPRRLQSNNLLISSSVSSSDALCLFPYSSPFSCCCLAFKTSRHLANCGPLLTFRLEFSVWDTGPNYTKILLMSSAHIPIRLFFLWTTEMCWIFHSRTRQKDFRFRFFLQFAPNMSWTSSYQM